jgi:hypothetical protein
LIRMDIAQQVHWHLTGDGRCPTRS